MGLFAVLLSLLGCSSEKDFAEKDGTWYYRTATIVGSDAASFKVLSDHYAKDRHRAYYGDSYRDSREYFLVKRDRVKVLEGADAASFRYLDEDYARDAKSLFYEGVRFSVQDVETFQILKYGFARDRAQGYYLRTPIAGSDGASFEALDDGHHARDKARVYYCSYEHGDEKSRPGMRARVLKAAAPAEIQVLDSGYAKTGTSVFHRGEAVKGADAASFETPPSPEEGSDARDKNGLYQNGSRRKAGPAAAS